MLAKTLFPKFLFQLRRINPALLLAILLLIAFVSLDWLKLSDDVQGAFRNCSEMPAEPTETLRADDDVIAERIRQITVVCAETLPTGVTSWQILHEGTGLYANLMVGMIQVLFLCLTLTIVGNLAAGVLPKQREFLRYFRFTLAALIAIAILLALFSRDVHGALRIAQKTGVRRQYLFSAGIDETSAFAIYDIGVVNFLLLLLGAILLMTREKPRWVMYGLLITGALVAIIPFFWMISTSLMPIGDTINRRWIPSRVDLQTVQVIGANVRVPENYVTAWDEAKFSQYFWHSVVITTLIIVGLLVTSVLAGYAFARIHFMGRDVLFTLILSTLMIPESVTMIPNLLMIRGEILPLPTLSQFPALAAFPWIELGGSWYNGLAALTVPFMGSAFSIFLLRQFFAKIPDELWDAARMDGAGHLRFLLQVCLPISRPAIFTVTLLTFIFSWNAFLWPLVATTTEKWRPLMVGLWSFMSEFGPQTHLLMAGSVIAILPILLLYFATQKSFTEGIATTGLKG